MFLEAFKQTHNVNEYFYDLLAQVIPFDIVLKSDMFEKKTKWEITT